MRFFAVKGLLLFLSLASFVSVPASAQEYAGQTIARQILRTTVAADGQPIHYFRTDKPEVTAAIVKIPPGGQTGWHRHPVPVYAYVIQGTLEVEMANGDAHTYHAGDALVEMVGTPHNGRNVGSVPLKLVAFYAGGQGVANTQRVAEENRPAAR